MPEITLRFSDDLPANLPILAERFGVILTEHPLATRPTDRHWHLKRAGQRGTLEITWRPVEHELLLIVRPSRKGQWTDEEIQRFADALEGPGPSTERSRLGNG